MNGPTKTGMSSKTKTMIAMRTNRRDGPEMRLRPLPKPERSMFDQSMLPQSLPPSPPRPRSRIDLRIGAVSFAWSLGRLRTSPGLSNLPQGGEILDLDPILVPARRAFHRDEVVE